MSKITQTHTKLINHTDSTTTPTTTIQTPVLSTPTSETTAETTTPTTTPTKSLISATTPTPTTNTTNTTPNNKTTTNETSTTSLLIPTTPTTNPITKSNNSTITTSHTTFPTTNSNNNITTTATSSSIINSVPNAILVSTTPTISTTPTTNISSDVKFPSSQPTTTFNSISLPTSSSLKFSIDPTISPHNSLNSEPTNKLSSTNPPTNHLSNIEPTKDISTTIPPPNLEPSTNISTTLDKASKKLKKVSKPVTDTCWNWVVLVACTFSTTIMGSSYILFSLIYSDLVSSFDSSTSSAGWIGSIHVGCVNLFGIPFGLLIDRFGCRVIAVFGTLLCSLGFVLSAFATSITYLIITYGVLSGCGLGMICLSSIITTMRNFDKKRPIAGAIFSCGYSIGSVGIGPVLNIVFNHFSWRGCLIIYAGFVLQMVVATTLTFKPQQYVDVWEPCDDDEDEVDGIKEVDTLTPLLDSTKVQITHTNLPLQPSSFPTLSILRKNLSNFDTLLKVKKEQYKSLLTDQPLVFYLMASFWMYMGVQSFIQHMPNRALKLGIERKMVSYLPTSNNGVSGITKIIAGLIGNLPGVNRGLMYSFALLGTGLSQCLIPLCHTFNTLFMQGLLEGAFIGFIFSIVYVILVDLKGLENFTTTQPLLTMTFGLGAMLSTPLTGFIYDKTDNYDITFLITSGIILLGTFFSFVSVAILHKRDKKMAKDNVKKVPRKTSGFVSLSSLN